MDCTSTTDGAQLVIDKETGEITITKKRCAESRSGSRVAQQNFTDQPVKNYRRQDYKKQYGKLHNLGAHAMMQMPVCKFSKVMLLMLRDSTYKGICYINPVLVSKELGMDIEYARKMLKKIEDCDFAIKVDTGNGYYYLIRICARNLCLQAGEG